MNGKGVVLITETENISTNNMKKEAGETQVFEEIQTESTIVSEIRTEDNGTRFARLKRVLRKRSVSIF